MSERGIPDIMNQPCTLQDTAYILLHLRGKTRISFISQNILSDILSEGFGKRRHLQRMCQPCPDKVTFIKRKDLRLILKAPERCTSDDPVIILLKLTAQICTPRIFIFM